MSKRKNSDPGRVRQLHPTRSFEQLVADATQAKLAGYIDSEIQGLGQALLQRQAQSLQGVMQRIVAIEEILLETVPGLTRDAIANRVADISDRADGYTPAADETVQVGDRVRLEIKTRTADQTEYQGQSRLQIDNVGSGNTIGKELEDAIVGMKSGETKEIKFGKDASLTASLAVNKVSRQPAPPAEETEEAAVEATATETPAAEVPAEEVPSASVNAG